MLCGYDTLALVSSRFESERWLIILTNLGLYLNQFKLLQTPPVHELSGKQQAVPTSNTVSSSNGQVATQATGQVTTAPVTSALIVAPKSLASTVAAPVTVTAPTTAPAPVATVPTIEQALPLVSVAQALTIAQGSSALPAAIDLSGNKYFDPQHQQEYGVEIVERDPATDAVVAVQCLFCVHMGRDPTPETAKRQRSQRVWVWKKFGAKNYRRHHERMHSELWPLYESSSAADKAVFFGVHKDYQPGSLPVVARPIASAPVVRAPVVSAPAAVGGVMMPSVMPGAGVGMMMPGGGGGGNAPMKRPRGRPRKNGIAAIQWTEPMVERLVMLRYVIILIPVSCLFSTVLTLTLFLLVYILN